MRTNNSAADAAAAYNARVSVIRETVSPSTIEYAVAMSEACAEYERAMVADVGERRARRMGAGEKSVRL